MTDHGNTVLREALALPAEERVQVAAELLASLDEERDEVGENTADWAIEIERRARQVRNDQSSGEDWDTARQHVARQLHSR